jgi:hypothetical protein
MFNLVGIQKRKDFNETVQRKPMLRNLPEKRFYRSAFQSSRKRELMISKNRKLRKRVCE